MDLWLFNGFTGTGYRNNRVFPLTNPYISNIVQQCRWSYLERGLPVIQPRIFFGLRVRLSPRFVELQHGAFLGGRISIQVPAVQPFFYIIANKKALTSP